MGSKDTFYPGGFQHTQAVDASDLDTGTLQSMMPKLNQVESNYVQGRQGPALDSALRAVIRARNANRQTQPLPKKSESV